MVCFGVLCKTAYAALGHRCTQRLNSPRRPAWKTCQDLDLTRPVSHQTLSHTMLRTVICYCCSADHALARHHVPQLRGLDALPNKPNSPPWPCRSPPKPGPTCRTLDCGPVSAWKRSAGVGTGPPGR
jgi:hypothetical protein